MIDATQNLRKYKLMVLMVVFTIAVRLIYYNTLMYPYVFPDTSGYTGFDFYNFFHNGRTFVYPVFLAVLRTVFGADAYLRIACVVQDLISIISIVYMHKTIILLTNKKSLAKWVSFFYGNSIAVLGWNYCILTESMALSFTVIYLYYFLFFLNNKNDKNGLLCVFLLFIMIFLRPTFLLFFVLFLLMLFGISLHSSSINVKATIKSSFTLIVLILLYSCAFYRHHGIFTISDPMPRQLLHVVISRDYYRNNTDLNWIMRIDNSKKVNNNMIWPAVEDVMRYYDDLAFIQKKSKECIILNGGDYVKDEVFLAKRTIKHKYDSYKQNKAMNDFVKKVRYVLDKVGSFITIQVSIVLSVFYALLFAYNLRERVIDWASLFFAIHIPLVFISTIIATCGEYMRTMIHLYPITIIGIAMMLAYFKKIFLGTCRILQIKL